MKKLKQIKQTNQNNVQVEKEKKSAYQYDEYFDFFEYKMKPASDRFMEHLSKKLIHWALNDPDAYKLSQFWLKEGITPSTGYRWCRDREDMKLAHDIALLAIGNRREMGAIKKDLDAGMIKYMMPQYDSEWRSMAEWQSQMKIENEGGGSINVTMMTVPDSPLVPEKPQRTPEEVAAMIHKKVSSDKFYGGK